MKPGDRVKDKLYYEDCEFWRGTGTVVSTMPCPGENCPCGGFVAVHWQTKHLTASQAQSPEWWEQPNVKEYIQKKQKKMMKRIPHLLPLSVMQMKGNQ